MIEFKNVYKSFTEHHRKIIIANNLNIKFPNKGLVVLQGRSGCGKTTLLRMISGRECYDGDILYNDYSLNSLSKRKKQLFYEKNIFYLKFENNFPPKLLFKEALKLYLNKDEIGYANSFIKEYEIENLLNKRIENFSSGELQKVSLCIALSKKIRVLILDEPICNLDVQTVNKLVKTISDKSKECLIIYVSHYETDINNYYDMLLEMHEGKLNTTYSNRNKHDSVTVYDERRTKLSFMKFFIHTKSKRNFVVPLFQSIVFLLTFFLIFFSVGNNYNYDDIYISNSKYQCAYYDCGANFNLDYDCFKKDNIYFFSIDYNILQEDDYKNIYDPQYAIYDDFFLTDRYAPQNWNEISITDYWADLYHLSVNDKVYLRAIDDYLIVKHIIPTDYFTNRYHQIEFIYPLKYNFMFVHKDFPLITYQKKATVIGFALEPFRFVTADRYYQTDSMFKEIIDDNTIVLSRNCLEDLTNIKISSNEDILLNDIEIPISVEDNTIYKTFEKVYVTCTQEKNRFGAIYVGLSEKRLKEIIDELDIYNYELKTRKYIECDVVDFTKDSFKEFSHKYLNYDITNPDNMNRSNFYFYDNDEFKPVINRVYFIKKVYNFMLPIFITLYIIYALIYSFFIIKHDLKYHNYLIFNNISLKNAIIYNLLFRLIIDLIIASILYVCYINMFDIVLSKWFV